MPSTTGILLDSQALRPEGSRGQKLTKIRKVVKDATPSVALTKVTGYIRGHRPLSATARPLTDQLASPLTGPITNQLTNQLTGQLRGQQTDQLTGQLS